MKKPAAKTGSTTVIQIDPIADLKKIDWDNVRTGPVV